MPNQEATSYNIKTPGAIPVIPPRRNRRQPHEYDAYLFKNVLDISHSHRRAVERGRRTNRIPQARHTQPHFRWARVRN